MYKTLRLAVHPYRRTILFGVCMGIVMGITIIAFAPPAHFAKQTLITLPSGASSPVIAHILKQEHIIRSEILFTSLARVTGKATHLSGGTYLFSKPVSVFTVLSQVAQGTYGISADRITFTEGMTNANIRDVLSNALPGFNRAMFITAASTSEGYLFPDTYYLLPGTSERAIVARLRGTFAQKVASTSPIIAVSGHSLHDVVIVASILEREAKTPRDMQHVSGILWNRIRIGMPLQVDAVFGYINGVDGYTPTAKDLESESLYNTYRVKGLPPTPIDNPGLGAILAAATPLQTSDEYYLTGKDGSMHYAKTFEEHKKNRAQYLDI
jgi:UPF0755 protein